MLALNTPENKMKYLIEKKKPVGLKIVKNNWNPVFAVSGPIVICVASSSSKDTEKFLKYGFEV